MKTPVNKTSLKNGVRILTKKMPYTRSVSMGVWVNVGSRDETHADHIHYSSRGNKLAAGALLEFMTQHDMLPQPRK